MPYPEFLIAPMREELTDVGFTELRTATDVDQAVAEKGTTLVRASFDLTVGRDLEAQLAIEGDEVAPLRLVGTASPRRAPW